MGRPGRLNGIKIKALGEFDGFLYGFPVLARQPHDEGAVDGETQFLAVFCKFDGLFLRDPLLDVLEDLLVTRFIADHHVP